VEFSNGSIRPGKSKLFFNSDRKSPSYTSGGNRWAYASSRLAFGFPVEDDSGVVLTNKRKLLVGNAWRILHAPVVHLSLFLLACALHRTSAEVDE
jgi:hypothetical protein